MDVSPDGDRAVEWALACQPDETVVWLAIRADPPQASVELCVPEICLDLARSAQKLSDQEMRELAQHQVNRNARRVYITKCQFSPARARALSKQTPNGHPKQWGCARLLQGFCLRHSPRRLCPRSPPS